MHTPGHWAPHVAVHLWLPRKAEVLCSGTTPGTGHAGSPSLCPAHAAPVCILVPCVMGAGGSGREGWGLRRGSLAGRIGDSVDWGVLERQEELQTDSAQTDTQLTWFEMGPEQGESWVPRGAGPRLPPGRGESQVAGGAELRRCQRRLGLAWRRGVCGWSPCLWQGRDTAPRSFSVNKLPGGLWGLVPAAD